jgi:hypothetical protein
MFGFGDRTTFRGEITRTAGIVVTAATTPKLGAVILVQQNPVGGVLFENAHRMRTMTTY